MFELEEHIELMQCGQPCNTFGRDIEIPFACKLKPFRTPENSFIINFLSSNICFVSSDFGTRFILSYILLVN